LSTTEPKACQHLEFWRRRALYQKKAERQGLWRRMKSRSVVSQEQKKKFFSKTEKGQPWEENAAAK